jgi:hypothetical protein
VRPVAARPSAADGATAFQRLFLRFLVCVLENHLLPYLIYYSYLALKQKVVQEIRFLLHGCQA